MRRAALCLLLALTLAGVGLLCAARLQPPSQVPALGLQQGLLSFPAWYFVHSQAEYADYSRAQPAHGFPFCAQLGQLWSGYFAVANEQQTRAGAFPLVQHVSISSAALRNSLEYALRAAYENSVGRVTWVLGGGKLSEEEHFAAAQAQHYADFLRRAAWYDYDFITALRQLWSEVPWLGAGLLRKWERRYALSTEYLLKAAQAWLISQLSAASPAPAPSIVVVADTLPPAPASAAAKVLQRLPSGAVLLQLPRGAAFRLAATALARQRVNLRQVGAEDGEVFISLWRRGDSEIPLRGARVLFSHNLLTRPGLQRVALLLPVSELSQLLRDAAALGLSIEHVYT